MISFEGKFKGIVFLSSGKLVLIDNVLVGYWFVKCFKLWIDLVKVVCCVVIFECLVFSLLWVR